MNPDIQVTRNIDAQTALVAVHRVAQPDATFQHVVEVMSYIASRPLPEDDFDMARAFVWDTCLGVSDEDLKQALVSSGAGGYYR